MSVYEQEALDMIESKIKELEIKVYGDKVSPTENFNPVTESLLQANTLMVAALSGRERITSIFKRLHELNEYLTPGYEESYVDVSTKVNIILSMEDEFKNNLEVLDKIQKSKDVLDEGDLKELPILQNELDLLMNAQAERKDKLNEISLEVQSLLAKFNEICVEIAKSFVCLNDAISKLEQERMPKKRNDY